MKCEGKGRGKGRKDGRRLSTEQLPLEANRCNARGSLFENVARIFSLFILTGRRSVSFLTMDDIGAVDATISQVVGKLTDLILDRKS